VLGEGYSPNVYVADELYVAEVSSAARDYAEFQHLQVHPVGDLLDWLSQPPTKLVCVGDPGALSDVERRAKKHFGDRMYISKSLPYFLEFAAPGVTKGAGLDFLARHLGFTPEQTVAFGDGENDVELVEWAGYGVAVENAHERVKAVADWVAPSAQDEGVAQVMDALLDLHSTR
jgi:Cof subfamily protein (haloacid dehalogenase superfamily)